MPAAAGAECGQCGGRGTGRQVPHSAGQTILRTRSYKHNNPLEHATENPLDNSSKHPLDGQWERSRALAA